MRLRARLRGEEERRRSAVLGLLHRDAERRRHRTAAPALAARARCAPRTAGAGHGAACEREPCGAARPCRRAASRGAGAQDVRRRSRIAAAGCHRGWPARRACGPGRRRARAAAAQRRRSARLHLHCPRPGGRKRGRQQRGKGSTSRGRADNGPRLVDKNALSARGGGPPRQSRSPSPDSPPAKRASSADSSGYDTDLPDEVQQEAVRKVCGALSA